MARKHTEIDNEPAQPDPIPAQVTVAFTDKPHIDNVMTLYNVGIHGVTVGVGQNGPPHEMNVRHFFPWTRVHHLAWRAGDAVGTGIESANVRVFIP